MEKDLELQEIKEITNKVFTERALEKNTTPEAYVENLQEELKANSKAAGASELQDLVNLIVITHQETTMLKSDMWEFISQFIVQPNENNGNGRRFIKHYPQTGRDFTEVENKFLPDGFTKQAFAVKFIQFKDANGDIEPTSDRLVFDITYSFATLITYFINGQLSEFIKDQIIGKIGQSITITVYDLIMKEIVKEDYKVINGTAKNLFDCLVDDVFPQTEEMKQNSSDFNVDQTNKYAIDASKKEDMIMIISPGLKAKLNAAIMSQLFNSAKIELTNFVGKVYVANRKFKKSDIGTWQTEATSYVDDNTIIVIDKANFFKCMKMLEFTGSQEYPLNMSELRVSHLWFAKGKLPWGKGFIYKNANLMTMPGNEVPAAKEA